MMETAKNFLVTKGVDFLVQVLAAIALATPPQASFCP